MLGQEIAQQGAVLATVLHCQASALVRARDLWAAAHRRFVVGIGSSRHVADYGAACSVALGAGPAVLLASPGASVNPPSFRAADVLVAVSQSGRTPTLLALVQDAIDAGAQVISVTNANASPLQALAHATLLTGAGPESVIPATKSVTASMLLLRALAGPPVGAHVDRLAETVEQLLLSVVVGGRPLPSVVVASGFAAEAVSDEVALKLAEVTAHLAVAETLVDFLHGPAAVPAPLLALLAPEDPNTAAVLTRSGVLVAGAEPDDDVVIAPTGDPTLDAIARVVAGQVLALRWAEAFGIDPDDPRGLHKVTLTA